MTAAGPDPYAETVAHRMIAEALEHHRRTTHVAPQGDRVQVCGTCTYGDGVPFVWPCPKVAALTEAEAGNWRDRNARAALSGPRCSACNGPLVWRRTPLLPAPAGIWQHQDDPDDDHAPIVPWAEQETR